MPNQAMHYAIRDFMHKSLPPESGSPSRYALGAGMHYQLMHYEQVYCITYSFTASSMRVLWDRAILDRQMRCRSHADLAFQVCGRTPPAWQMHNIPGSLSS